MEQSNLSKIPSPQELMAENPMTQAAICITNAVIEILKEQYVGRSFTVKQKEITAKISYPSGVRAKSEDWDKMEIMLRKAGWSIVYDGPAYCESYDAYYKIGPKK